MAAKHGDIPKPDPPRWQIAGEHQPIIDSDHQRAPAEFDGNLFNMEYLTRQCLWMYAAGTGTIGRHRLSRPIIKIQRTSYFIHMSRTFARRGMTGCGTRAYHTRSSRASVLASASSRRASFTASSPTASRILLGSSTLCISRMTTPASMRSMAAVPIP